MLISLATVALGIFCLMNLQLLLLLFIYSIYPNYTHFLVLENGIKYLFSFSITGLFSFTSALFTVAEFSQLPLYLQF